MKHRTVIVSAVFVTADKEAQIAVFDQSDTVKDPVVKLVFDVHQDDTVEGRITSYFKDLHTLACLCPDGGIASVTPTVEMIGLLSIPREDKPPQLHHAAIVRLVKEQPIVDFSTIWLRNTNGNKLCATEFIPPEILRFPHGKINIGSLELKKLFANHISAQT